MRVLDASFLNAAAAKDELTVALWAKHHDIANNSAFWISSPTQARAYQAHLPWDSNIYFDTAGTAARCCDGFENRINQHIDQFVDYTGELSWWTNSWHHYVFIKKADYKQVWIDGKLFLEGYSTGVLATNLNGLLLGAETGGNNRLHALVDDYAFFSTALTEAQINSIRTGTLPSALPASAGLIGYWNFNDAATQPADPARLTAVRSGANITIQWAPAGGTLESSPALGAGAVWTAVGTANPATVTVGNGSLFYRVRR